MLEGHDISIRLEAVFEKIHAERMHGVPILNARLKVEAVGTREWNGHWLTVLITPWFINLMLLPQNDEQAVTWSKLGLGSSVAHRFPAGRFDFLVGEEGALGRYQMCSLFSPVLEFEDQDAARIAAQAALGAVFDASLAESAATAKETVAESGKDEPPADQSAAASKSRQVSRRGLLIGKAAPEKGSLG